MTVPSGRRARMSRREFIRRSAGTAIALPSLSAILAACSKPGTTTSSGGGSGSASPTGIPLARPDKPVTLPMVGEPIATDTPIETNTTVKIYNWADYMWKKVLKEFEDKFNTKIEVTTFNNMSEALQKLSSGQVQADVFFPTVDVLGKLVTAKLLQPLNHDLIPNLAANMWSDFQNPFYDQGWRYTVPYTIYTTGIGYRSDHVDPQEVADKQYSILWDPKYGGKVGFYDDYREALAMAMLKNGITDTNTASQSDIDVAKNDLLKLVQDNNARLSINGTYVGIPESNFFVHQAWSGDMIGAQWYMPKGESPNLLGYWFPEDGKGVVGNDLIAVLSSSQNPRLAHEFLNFFLDKKYATQNFSWNGYQPPLTSMNPDTLIPQGYVPKSLPTAIVRPQDFESGYWLLELDPTVDQIWLNAWDEVKAGA